MSLHRVIDQLEDEKRAAILSHVLREETSVQAFVEKVLAEKAEQIIAASKRKRGGRK